jgi:hypothetical protein
MKTREWNPPSLRFDATRIEDGGCQARSVLECGDNPESFRGTPLSDVPGTVEKLRRRFALPEQSKICRFSLLLCFIILHSSFCLRAVGQQYSINWFKVAGGGGMSTGGTYQVSGIPLCGTSTPPAGR